MQTDEDMTVTRDDETRDIPAPHAVGWRGRTGHEYALWQEDPASFVLKGHDLYVITDGDTARWIGTADDIIDDQASRARFRAAMAIASSVLRLPAPADVVERMKTQWDLEGGYRADMPPFCLAS